MTLQVEQSSAETTGLLRLRVAAEPDPSALTRVLALFQNLNVVPRRVIAEFGTAQTMHVQIDVAGLSEHRLSMIAAKIDQVPCVLNAYWHRA
jgi:hypothetical protein